MSELSSVYDNSGRKRELVAELKQLQEFHLQATDSLEGKAWNILSVSSATFGLVSAIQVALISDQTPGLFWIGLIAVLVLYLIQVHHILQAIKPLKWYVVPGAGSDNRYETFIKKYIAVDGVQLTEDEYYNQLIADYIGNLAIEDGKTVIPGSIQKIEANNALKAAHIQSAARLLSLIIAALIGLSFGATFGR